MVTILALQGHPDLCLLNSLPDPPLIFIDTFCYIAGGEDLPLLLFQGEEFPAGGTPVGKKDHEKYTNGTCRKPPDNQHLFTGKCIQYDIPRTSFRETPPWQSHNGNRTYIILMITITTRTTSRT